MMKTLIAIALAVLLAISIPVMAAPKSVSKANLAIISECVKPFARYRVTKVAIIQIYDGLIYHVVRHMVDNSNDLSLNQFLIKIKNKQCDAIYSDMMGDGPPVSEVIKGDLGRVATRDFYRYLIIVQGKDSLQKWLSALPANTTQLNDVQKEELEKLGFNVNK
jgi:hypothetical protein